MAFYLEQPLQKMVLYSIPYIDINIQIGINYCMKSEEKEDLED